MKRSLRSVLALIVALLLALGLCAQAETPAVEGSTAVVTGWMVNIRASASSKAEELGVAREGDVVKVLGTEGSWTHILTADGLDGYIYHTYLGTEANAPSGSTSASAVAIEPNAWVTADALNLRAQASASAEVLTVLVMGEGVETLGEEGAWVKVRTAGGFEGYVSRNYLQETAPAEGILTGSTVGAVSSTRVTATSLNIRAAASSSAEVVGAAALGEEVEVLGEEGNWVHIRTAAGIEGFASAKYLEAYGGVMPAEVPETAAQPTAPAPEMVEPTLELITPTPETPAPTPEPYDESYEPTDETYEPDDEVYEPDDETYEPEEEESETFAEAPLEAVAVEAEIPDLTFEYMRDENGDFALDESGEPIALVPEDVEERPIAFSHSADGELVLDEAGLPIPTQFLPIHAQQISSSVEVDHPERRIDIYLDWGGDVLRYGDEATIIAVLHGYDGLQYTLRWQVSNDEVEWMDVRGANTERCRFVISKDNYLYYWRVLVYTGEN